MMTRLWRSTAVNIRWMIRSDMPQVCQIEGDCFDYPWLEENFITFLRRRNTIGMVAEHKNRVAGYMLYELHKNRLHLLTIAVLPGRWLEGVGRQMLERLKDKLSATRRQRIVLEVRETNLPAPLFFSHCGFKAVKVLHDYYDGSTEAAYVMEYHHKWRNE